MNSYSLIIASAIVAVTSVRVVAAEPWEDPMVNEINRLPAREVSIPCHTEQLAFDIKQMDEQKSASRWIQSLAGEWNFKWKRATAVADWEKTAKIMVPSCWQLQGEYDPALYINTRYAIEKAAPLVTVEPKDKTWTSYTYRNPVGLYTTTFSRPWRWWFRRTIIHFDGVSSAFKLRVNGKEVGYSEDSRLPAEFDITEYLNIFCANTLEVEVYKHSDGTYMEDQDFWRLSGIFRDVYLISEHKNAPFDLVVETQFSEDMKNGKFIVRDEKGNIVKEREVPNVRLWSNETPYLYMTPIEHKWGWWIFGGTDYRAVTFGFRKIEIRDSVLYLNGKRLLIKGANRHEMEPESGYTVTKAGMLKDIRNFKSFNINAVRTCHYPNVPEWYDLCDREGIMVVCEANNETHGYGYEEESLAKRKDFRKQFLERGTRMVQTFRNHPSIIYWSMGNECGDGENFTALYKAMKEIDPTRPVHYERALNGDNTDIMAEMYAYPSKVEKYVANNPKKPYILCEYTHAMGNSNGGVQEYWDLVKKYPSFQGGFVWDYVDQALWKVDEKGKWLAYGGDFGDKPNDDNFNCNGLFDALRNPHPGAYEVKHAYQSIETYGFNFETGKVKMRNNYLFKNLEDMYCCWKSFRKGETEPVAKGTFELGEVEPGQEAEYTLEGFAGDAVVFNIYDDRDCVAWDGFSKPFKPVKVEGAKTAVASHPFKFNFWRAPIDNDRGWKMPEKCKIWKNATDSQKLPAGVKSDLKVSKVGEDTLVEWTLTVPKGLPPIPRVGLTFTVPKTDEVNWYGLGPWENYSDRTTAVNVGAYKASIGLVSGLADPKSGTIKYLKDRLNPDNYIEPGEQGYRTGCETLTIGSVTIDAVNAPFGFNVWPYPQTMLEGKKHQWELTEANELTVNVDAVQMGVGGDNSWGATPHAQYMPKDGTYKLSFVVKGLK